MKSKTEILRLMQGYPQDWIYIERKVKYELKSSIKEGVKAPFNFVGKTTSQIFRKDLMDVNSRKIATIRPIIGPNGAGKTTQLNIQVKKLTQKIFPEKSIYLFYDFKFFCDSEEEFWPIFFQSFYEKIHENNLLHNLCSLIPKKKLRGNLTDKFKNIKLVEQILNSISSDEYAQGKAKAYFFSNKIKKKDIQDFFYGFIDLALELDKIVVLGFDEIQYLIDISPDGPLVKIFLEKFIRKLMEQFRNRRLYILISCLQNPGHEEYEKLKNTSLNFKSIVEGKEILLDNLIKSEKEQILDQVCQKLKMDKNNRKNFQKRVKNRLDFFMPRYLLQSIAGVLEVLGYTTYSSSDLKEIYEKEARDFMKPKLNDKGFIYIENEPKKVGGYNVDIYASAETKRNKRVPKAFGEVTITQRRSIKQKVEKFSAWLYQMKGKEYRPDLGDFAFFVCPPERITSGSREILDSNSIGLIEFQSSLIEEIESLENQDEVEEQIFEEVVKTEVLGGIAESSVKPPIDIKKRPESVKKPFILKKEPKFKLQDVPGIGPSKIKLLEKANIFTVEDLVKCNANIASVVKGLGLTSINKWKQAAKQILDG